MSISESKKEKILNVLDKAQARINTAYDMLSDEDQELCEKFAGLTCDIDEAISEVENL